MQSVTEKLLGQLDELHVSLCRISQLSKLIQTGKTASQSEALVAFEKVEATLKDLMGVRSQKSPATHLRLVSCGKGSAED